MVLDVTLGGVSSLVDLDRVTVAILGEFKLVSLLASASTLYASFFRADDFFLDAKDDLKPCVMSRAY